jgi:ATP-dependent helicase/nuclease subunit B
LEAAMLLAGAFKDVPVAPIGEIAFWQLHGRKNGGEASIVEGDAATLAKNAHEGLLRLIAAFDDPNTPYEARPNPDMAPAYSDYLHLARVKEWISAGEDEA